MKKSIAGKVMSMCTNLLLIFFLLISFSIKANSIAGGSLRYESLGNGQYLVTAEIIRDCAGGSAPLTETLTISSLSCSFSQTYTMNNNPGSPVVPGFSLCSSRPSTCNGGIYHGFQEWIYSVVVTLPASCIDWIFSIRDLSLASGITTIQNPDSSYFYLEAALNNLGQDNQSIQIGNYNYVGCVSQLNTLNLGVYNLDGDSLYFSFIDVQTDANASALYNPGYSAINPLTSFNPVSIDSYTGVVTISPTDTSEFGIVAIRVYEYRNGNMIGYSTVYYPLLLVDCNHSPVINCPSSAINVEATEQFCYDITAFDSYPDDTILMSWNNGIPGASFTFSSNPDPIGHFCWTPSVNDISPLPYSFVVIFNHKSCIGAGIYACTISLIVTPFTGIQTIENESGINLFPNPTTGFFDITADTKFKIKKVIISDLLGKVILVSNAQSSIDLHEFKNGIYFVKVENQDGNLFYEKIIKQ